MRLLFVICLLFFGIDLALSQQSKIDSLTSRLSQPLHDTDRVNTLLALAAEYIHISPDTSLQYATEALKLSQKKGIMNIEQGISNDEVLIFTSTFIIPCSLFDIMQFCDLKPGT